MPAPASSATVRLVGMPLRMFEAAVEQWEGMLREYALRGQGGSVQPYNGHEVALAGNALATVVDAALAVRSFAADVSVVVGEGTVGGLSLLQGVLDDARHLVAAGELLVLPPLPEIVALRDWICDQVTEQTAGGQPSPWRLAAVSDDPDDTAVAEWDRSLAPPAGSAWLVGDDRNRIVAASSTALDLLGWSADDLVGQRLLVVIPHRLREAHLAGFTRSVLSGGGDLLGQPLSLPALARDGSEVPITLTLTRHAARAGRHVYLARLDGHGADPADGARP